MNPDMPSHFLLNLDVPLVCAGIAGPAVERARRKTQRVEEEVKRMEREVERNRRGPL
jgi:hypothetical protein